MSTFPSSPNLNDEHAKGSVRFKWDGAKWVGDVPDYGKTVPPTKGVGAFIMKPEGYARLFGPGLADGPFPEHYEPWESPVKNLMSKTQNDPAITIWKSKNL